MKKTSLLLSLIFILLTGCSASEETLYVLNWGDYINEELITKFEEEYKVKVTLTTAESNESMYEQIRSERTIFDVVIPSDYMIDQLVQEKLIQKIDYTKLSNYQEDTFNHLVNDYSLNNEYTVPYFNGTIGIMYSEKNSPEIAQLVEKHGWNILFNNDLSKGLRVGMYNSSRDAFAAALLSLGYDINTTDSTQLDKAAKLLTDTNYVSFADDTLKTDIVSGNIDIALVYSGDFYEQLIIADDEGLELDFGFYTPKNTNYWIDGTVIPSNSKNVELAHSFINFMIDSENSYDNVTYVGYASPMTKVMNQLSNDPDYDFISSHPFFDPSKIDGLEPQVFKFLGLDYMSDLEERFTRVRN